MLDIQSIGHPLLMWALAAVGAAAMYIFSQWKGFDHSNKFLHKIAPGHKDYIYERANLFLIISFGTIIGIEAFSPADEMHAIMAGLSWTGVISVAIKGEG